MYVVGVAKKYISGGRRHPRARKYWHVYGYDDAGRFVSYRVSFWRVPMLRRQIRRLLTVTCQACRRRVKILDPEKISGEIPCLYCGNALIIPAKYAPRE